MNYNNRGMRWLLIVFTLVVSLTLMGSTMMDGEHHHELRARLSGAAEVPGSGDPDGKGKAKITIMMDAMGNHQICWDIRVRDITLPATAAHIHAGPAGVADPVVFPLSAPDASGNAAG